jgi:type IV pilus assembly protein PilQ
LRKELAQLKKYTLCSYTRMKKNTLIILLVFFSLHGYSQTFEERLIEIKERLNVLSDSLQPSLNELSSFSLSQTPIQTFLRAVAQNHNLNVQIDPALNITITNNFTNVLVKDLLLFICESYELDIKFSNNIMSFSKFIPLPEPVVITKVKKLNMEYDPVGDLLTVDLKNDSLASFVKQLTLISSKNVITPSAENSNRLISGYIKSTSFDDALEKLAYINKLNVSKTEDNFYILEPLDQDNTKVGDRNARRRAAANDQQNITRNVNPGILKLETQDSLITIEVEKTPLIDVIKTVSGRLGKNHVFYSDILGEISLSLLNVSYDDFLKILFQTTAYTYKREKNLYLMGERIQEGLRAVEMIKLYYRTVQGIKDDIPTSLSNGVEVKVLTELNAFVFSGSTPVISELISYIKLIDQPVPNIMIEVIVVDLKNGYSLQTGIKAFLGDSVPPTSGQVLGGVDLTLSSSTINDVLDKLDGKGIVNLGRVTPKFYATLQALEENNNIDIRSTPKLSTMNGHEANLTIGESEYYVEQTQNITGGVNPITTTAQRFNRVEANLSLTINPVVAAADYITMTITAEFSNFIAPSVVGAPPGNATRRFDSRIRVRNGDMIILGGLEEVSKSETGSGVPLLSRIPILKWLFSAKSKQKTDNKLIVFIKPTVVY